MSNVYVILVSIVMQLQFASIHLIEAKHITAGVIRKHIFTIMSFAILTSLILFSLILSCIVADLQSLKLRSLLSSTSTTTSNVHQFLPSDGNFEYRISYKDDNSHEFAIYSPPSQTNEQQWFHGANLLNEIKTSADGTFAINVDNYCLYHSPVTGALREENKFYWFDCTYNPSQTLEKRIATHYHKNHVLKKFRVFFSFENPESNEDHVYDEIILSIRTTVPNNRQSVTQIPIYCVTNKTDIAITKTTSPLDMFPWELANQEEIVEGQYLWKYGILFDKLINQTVNDDNVSNFNYLVFPVTVSIQFM